MRDGIRCNTYYMLACQYHDHHQQQQQHMQIHVDQSLALSRDNLFSVTFLIKQTPTPPSLLHIILCIYENTWWQC